MAWRCDPGLSFSTNFRLTRTHTAACWLPPSSPSKMVAKGGRDSQDRSQVHRSPTTSLYMLAFFLASCRLHSSPPDSVNSRKAETRALRLRAGRDGVWERGGLAECWAQWDCEGSGAWGERGGQQAGTGPVHKQTGHDVERARGRCVEHCGSAEGRGEDGFLRGTFPGTSTHRVL